jgi:hypothetical protein
MRAGGTSPLDAPSRCAGQEYSDALRRATRRAGGQSATPGLCQVPSPYGPLILTVPAGTELFL